MTRAETKPDLVLIHGWGLGNLAWSAVLPALMQRFSVHLLDLPGYRPLQPAWINSLQT